MSKIGIYGGTFNPIHNGHISVAIQVKEKLGLDKIVFVPTGIAPHKDNGEFVSKTHRYNMTALAIDGLFDISDVEVKTDRVCYAIDTIKVLQNIYKNDKLYYIIGADSLLSFTKWKNPIELFNILHIVAVDRDNKDIETKADEYRELYGADITICHIEPIDISSTIIRHNIKFNKSISDLVPKKVEDYIKQNNLYAEA